MFVHSLVSLLVSGLLVASTPVEEKRTFGKKDAPIIWDGRVPKDFPLSSFDSYSTSLYNAEYVLGQEKWSEVIEYPSPWKVPASQFDIPVGAKPFELTINDKSIFAPGGNPQNGFRRSELLPITNNGTDASVQGKTAFHFSVRASPDWARALNFSHQYELAFIETNDYSSHVWTLKAGTPFGQKFDGKKKFWLGGSTAGGKAQEVLFEVPLVQNKWYNFVVETDWEKNTIEAYFSYDYLPLKRVVKKRANDATGKGQAHVGILKLPVGGSNPSQEGYQSKNLNEGLVYGGIFVEDTKKAEPKLFAWL